MNNLNDQSYPTGAAVHLASPRITSPPLSSHHLSSHHLASIALREAQAVGSRLIEISSGWTRHARRSRRRNHASILDALDPQAHRPTRIRVVRQRRIAFVRRLARVANVHFARIFRQLAFASELFVR